MTPTMFVIGMMFLFAVSSIWALRALPKEEWQILATVPLRKLPSGEWEGINFTFYGFFVATGVTVATAVFVLLTGATGYSGGRLVLFAAAVFGIGFGASKAVAVIVEKQKNTFSVAGATAMVFFVSPLLLFGVELPILGTLAALATSYCLGEAIGRFACMSFGCCYGKRVEAMPRWSRPLLTRFGTVFRGSLKKAVYEGRAEGVPLVPVQALASITCFLGGSIGVWLFLEGHVRSAFLFDLGKGFATLATPLCAALLGLLWLSAFLIYGKSTVTGSTIQFHKCEGR